MSCTPVDTIVSFIFAVCLWALAGYGIGRLSSSLLPFGQQSKRTTITKKPSPNKSEDAYDSLKASTLVYPIKPVVIQEGKIGKVTVRHNICIPPTHHIALRTRTYPFAGLVLLSPHITTQEKQIDLYFLNLSKYSRVFSTDDAVAQLYVVRHNMRLTIQA
jgi:hypothetical protein